MPNTPEFILRLSCPDRPGIVHRVTGFLLAEGGNILEAQQFEELASQRFFMRVHFSCDADVPLEALRQRFEAIAQSFTMDWDVVPAGQRLKTLLMVSKQGHCLIDLLFRWQSGLLPIDVVGVVSNHEDFGGLVGNFHLPFHYLPMTGDTKPQQEAQLWQVIEGSGAQLVVLARYMQVLSPELSARLQGRAINIHHSFLPGFKGARPYFQAYDRGVKLIGATAHYVTDDLDEGPIIEQEVARVDHRQTPEKLTAIGRDLEAMALARAVRWHAEHRLMLSGRRTIVFQ